MGLINFLLRLLGLKKDAKPGTSQPTTVSYEAASHEPERSDDLVRPKLDPLRYSPQRPEYEKLDRGSFLVPKQAGTATPPYKFASSDVRTGAFLDLSQDGDQDRLYYFGLIQEPKTPRKVNHSKGGEIF